VVTGPAGTWRSAALAGVSALLALVTTCAPAGAVAAASPPPARPAVASALASPSTPGSGKYDVQVAVSTTAADLAAQSRRLAALQAQLAAQSDGLSRAQAELDRTSSAAATALQKYSGSVDALFQARQTEATVRGRLLRARLGLAEQHSQLAEWVQRAYRSGGGALADSPALETLLVGGLTDEIDTTLVALRRVGRVKSRRVEAYAAAAAEQTAAGDAADAAATTAEQAVAASAGAKDDAELALASQQAAVDAQTQTVARSKSAAAVAQLGVARAADAYAQAKAALDAARSRAASTTWTADSASGYAGGLAGSVGKVLSWAQSHVGEPYIFGATGPHAWDCSSFVRGAFAQVGIGLPRTAQAQRDWLAGGHGRPVQVGQERPGDLIFIDSYLGPNAVGHVMMVWNPATRSTIEARSTDDGIGHFTYDPSGHTIFQIWRVAGLSG